MMRDEKDTRQVDERLRMKSFMSLSRDGYLILATIETYFPLNRL